MRSTGKSNKIMIIITIMIITLVILAYLYLIGYFDKDKNGMENNVNTNKPTQEFKTPIKTAIPIMIDSTEKIKLGGVEQEVSIKTNNSSKPILLILHGGPGFVLRPLIEVYNNSLENNYIVVNWDQRGAGKSYNKNISLDSMNLKQFIGDAHELTDLLKKRYQKKKIYIMGHSFGTIIGLNLIKEFPKDYNAFISVGQVVSFAENEKLSYDFALKSSVNLGNTIAFDELKKIGRPDEKGNYKNDIGYEITSKWMENFGGDLYGKYTISEIYNMIFSNPRYNLNQEKFTKGYKFSQEIFEDKKIRNLDFRKEIKKVNVPVYFLIGSYDYDTPFELVKQYYELIKAPKKEIIWFERSAHFPFYEENIKFNEVLSNIANYN